MEDDFHEERLRTWLPRVEKLIIKALWNKKKNFRIIYIITTMLMNIGLRDPLLRHSDDDSSEESTSLRQLFLKTLSPLKDIVSKK